MRTITLSESVLRTHSLHSPCPKPPKFFSSYLFSLNSRVKEHNSKLSHQYPRLVFSRFSRRWGENTCGKLFGQFLEKDWENSDGIELRYCWNGKASKQLLHNVDDFGFSDKSPAKINYKRENHTTRSIPVLDTSMGGLLKFMLVFGFLTLQDSQQAVAGSDFASGLQLNSYLGDLGDISTGFVSAFLLIFFSELGDKTFFIAALLAARNSGAVVFIGTFGALATMTIISVVLGRTFHYVDEILPFRFGETDLPIDDIAAVCLLVYFGVSTLLEANSSNGLKAEEEQKEAEIAVSEFSGNGAGILSSASTVISTFLLVFVAEWGDKSFFSTIALAAASSPLGVIGGALAGHGVATLLAVLGGSLLGTFLSEKVIAYIGGVLFLIFAAVTLIEIIIRLRLFSASIFLSAVYQKWYQESNFSY
ncbi:GDT1-like protein 1, chloroplastic isoform X3 [Vitis vinifera]|uniref:GDT1-like protein 1, chloroplastic isoform X3 n=1 Tax=Vitis vinifera TaxID=29760 RepID=UPI00053FA78C|nr:GDT1-like protein 1, chloroplastic isoform X3 [Vitis vinifera]|eukprot:XP_010658587.1 PREDICTED: GDT1-like protein 1, chloroplastic isoform X2 [Vitis vinifera]